MIRERQCEKCGKTFQAWRNDAKNCGCRRPTPEELRKTCLNCQRPFTAVQRNQVDCSKKCQRRREYLANQQSYRDRSAKWVKENPERAKENRKAYYHANAAKFREDSKRWRKEHVEYARERDRKYKDKIRHGGVRERLIAEQGYICSVCGKEGNARNIVAHHTTFDSQNHEHQELRCRSCHARIHMQQRGNLNEETNHVRPPGRP